MCLPCYITLLFLKPSLLFHYITWACDLCDHDCDLWCHVFFAYVHNKEKGIETWNKINKEKEKENRIRPSSSFTTLTSCVVYEEMLPMDNIAW